MGAANGRARTRKSRRDTRSQVQIAIDERQAANHAAWAARHPDQARMQRQLRKGRAEALRKWKHKHEGTPETHDRASRRNQGALAKLYETGAIDAEQLAAAAEIAQVAERIGADVAVRTASVETRIDVTRIGDGSFFERLGQVRREYAYTRWRDALKHPAAVLDMLVGDTVGFTIVAKRYRMHNRRAKRLLIEALDLWPQILCLAHKTIDQRDLDAAHARLIG